MEITALFLMYLKVQCSGTLSKKFYRISSSPHQTLPNDNYDGPEVVCGKRKLFDRPLKK